MKTLTIALAALTLGLSATTMAAPNDWNHYRQADRHHHAPPAHKAPPKWSKAQRDHDRYRYNNLRRGESLPYQYRDGRYQVSNWHSSRLSQPPRGYHWVRADGRYLLVSNHNHRIYQVR